MEMQGKLGTQEVWTAEEWEIVKALLRTRPKPFPLDVRPLPPRVQSTYRPISVPTRRLRLTNRKNSSAKDKHFLTSLAVQIASLPPQTNASHILVGHKHQLIRGSLSATIRELGHLGLACRALETFQWQQQCRHLWPDERTLCATIEVLTAGGKEGIAWKLLYSHAPSSLLAFEALCKGHIANGLLYRALYAKQKAENSGMIIGQGLYSELVLLAARLNKVKEMKLLVEELGSFGELQLGLEHCTSIMAACRKSHMHDAVLSLFEWWKQAGFLPNVVMYQIVMTSLLDMGKPREALAIYWEMGKRGFAPHLPVYTALIDICVELKDVHRALRMLSHMKESNITPTGNIYKKLIKLCNQDGRFGKAKELAEAMRKEGLPIHDVEAHTDLCF